LKLKAELDSQQKHLEEVHARLERDKGGLFTNKAVVVRGRDEGWEEDGG
jgi:hypothetical protein